MPFVQLLLKIMFFDSKELCSTFYDDFLLHLCHFLLQSFFLLKDIPIDRVIPVFYVVLKEFELLLELVHF